jgi:hypothetical protein
LTCQYLIGNLGVYRLVQDWADFIDIQ